jgi:molybdenum-dependent DNA-binding transcriptional regulator ModE
MINGPALVGFVAVAEAGSVHAAARRLNISQAALSRRIQRLEADVGTPLFLRARRGLSLSPAGVRLIEMTRFPAPGHERCLPIEANKFSRMSMALMPFDRRSRPKFALRLVGAAVPLCV